MRAACSGGGVNATSILVFVSTIAPCLFTEGMRTLLFLCLYGFDPTLHFRKPWLSLDLLIFYY